MALLFSAHLDETGTDGQSAYAMVAGAVSVPGGWNSLESQWSGLLSSRGVSAFHTKEFNQGIGDFAGWGPLKRKNFVKGLEKIIKTDTIFQIAVGVHRETHTEVKRKWRGVRNFKADSDCGMCFRLLRFLVCEKIATEFSQNNKVQFIVESGPYTGDMKAIYEEVSGTKSAKSRPSRFGEMLAGFAHAPKGALRSLEAADYLAGRAIADLDAGIFTKPGRSEQISCLLTEDFMMHWNEDLIRERERRQAYQNRRKANKAAAPSNPVSSDETHS
jgi:hypothetical protein